MFGSNLELYVGNLQGLRTEVLTSNRGVWVQLGAACWKPTGLKDGSLDIKQGCLAFGSNLELYVGNLQGLRTEVLTSHRGVWVQLGAVCWQPTGLRTEVLTSNRGVCVQLGAVCWQPTLTSHRGVWVQLGAVCWQPTGLKDGSLDIKQGCLGPTWSCMLATYRA